jgi:nicotinamide mononucleotide adenylyltransferase
VQVRSFFLFPTMLMRVISGRFKPMRVGHHTGILRLRALMDDILFSG